MEPQPRRRSKPLLLQPQQPPQQQQLRLCRTPVPGIFWRYRAQPLPLALWGTYSTRAAGATRTMPVNLPDKEVSLLKPAGFEPKYQKLTDEIRVDSVVV